MSQTEWANDQARKLGKHRFDGQLVRTLAEYLDAQHDFTVMMDRGLVDDMDQVGEVSQRYTQAGAALEEAVGSAAGLVVLPEVLLLSDLDWVESFREKVEKHRERPREGSE